MGSIVVLVTLIYLSIQVRMARKESAAASIRERGSAMREVMLLQVSDDVLGGAFVKAGDALESAGIAPPMPILLEAGLSPLEVHKLQQFYVTCMHVYMTQHYTLDSQHRQIQDGGITLNFARGIGRIFWDTELRKIFIEISPPVTAHVDGLIAAYEARDTK
jgi:hypothetical protein